MLRCAAFLLVLVFSPGFAVESGSAPIASENVAVDYRNGIYFADLSLQVAVPPALAIEVLTDFEHMAAFVPNLVNSRIISRTGNVLMPRARPGPLARHGRFLGSPRTANRKRIRRGRVGENEETRAARFNKSFGSELAVQGPLAAHRSNHIDDAGALATFQPRTIHAPRAGGHSRWPVRWSGAKKAGGCLEKITRHEAGQSSIQEELPDRSYRTKLTVV
ncbi:MAG: hypothetical protein IPL05_03345 [Betaproteobacteria bacterium]|nr:hypothetical protein [Betaproteobacteria bacterium]